MSNLDRFQYINDPQNRPLDFISKCGCGGRKCRDSIHFGDECWEYESEFYASLECLAWAIGAVNVYAGTGELA